MHGDQWSLGKSVETRILIVDDSPLVRQRLRDLLQQHPDWRVCGEAANGQDAITRARELTPDVIVLDFLMPGMNDIQQKVFILIQILPT